MQFTKRLRERVQRGEITCSVRIWTRPHVQPGKRYRMGAGEIEVDSITAIELADITPSLARESGFAGVVDLLKTAKHGAGTNVYLVRFRYLPATARGGRRKASAAPAKPKSLPARKKSGGGERERQRVVRIVRALPEAETEASGTHLHLEVRKKKFGYFLADHHGDGRLAINCKSTPDVADALQQVAPSQFHIPKYLGNKGWIGLWLDVPKADWSAVELALREAYSLVAPRRLVAQLGASRAPGS